GRRVIPGIHARDRADPLPVQHRPPPPVALRSQLVPRLSAPSPRRQRGAALRGCGQHLVSYRELGRWPCHGLWTSLGLSAAQSKILRWCCTRSTVPTDRIALYTTWPSIGTRIWTGESCASATSKMTSS